MSLRYLTNEDRDNMRRFFTVFERHQAEINVELRRRAHHIESLRPVLELQSPADMARNEELGARLQRAAVFEDRWEEYLEHLRMFGAQYALAGMRFEDWFEILHAFRHITIPRVAEALSSVAELSTVLLGMDRFIDIAISSIGEAYLSTSLEKLEAQRRRERRIIDADPAAVVMLDENGVVLVRRSHRARQPPPLS